MLGFNMSQDEEKNISPEQKKFDDRFVIGVSLVVVVAVALIVADMNYLKVGFLIPIGFAIGSAAIVINLIKGFIDWRRKKAREASGEIQKRKPSTDVEAAAAKVASLKPKKKTREVSDRDYTAAALQSAVQDAPYAADPTAFTKNEEEEASLEIIIGFSTADPLLTGLGVNNPKAKDSED